LFDLPCTLYLPYIRQPIIDQQGPGLTGLIHKEAHPVLPHSAPAHSIY